LFLASAVAGALPIALSTGGSWGFLCFTFIAALAAPSLALRYASTKTDALFPGASWRRGFKANGWEDPLQSLRVSLLLGVGWVLGRAFAISRAETWNLMQFWAQVAFLVGLLLGVKIAHVLFRGRIA
jgi:hypothetical protein